jgi:hypothetical protein
MGDPFNACKQQLYRKMKRLDFLITLLPSIFGTFVAGMMFGPWWAIVGTLMGAGIGVAWWRFFPTIRLSYFIFVLVFAMMGTAAFGAMWGPLGAILGLFVGAGVMVGLITGILAMLKLLFRFYHHADKKPRENHNPIDDDL